MQELNEYLQQLISRSGTELHLEPNKQPVIVTSSGNAKLSTAPMPGAKINTMIFSLIPQNVKQQLPNNSQVEFVHPHNLGDFNFLVRKSPSGFIVTVNPLATNQVNAPVEVMEEPQIQQINNPPVSSNSVSMFETEQTAMPQSKEADEIKEVEEDLVVELNSPPQEKNEFLNESSIAEDVLSTSDYAFESIRTPEMSEYLPEEVSIQTSDDNSYPQIEVEEDDLQPQVEVKSASNKFEFESNLQIEESSAQEQIYEVEQLDLQANKPITNLEIPENTFNNMKPQNQTPINDQFVTNTPQVPQKQPVQQTHVPQKQTQPIQQKSIAPTPPPQTQETAKVSTPIVASNPQAKAKMDALFHKMNEVGASDLHISVSVPPMVRKDGRMAKLDPSQPALTPDSIKALLQSIMPQKNIEEFAERKDTDFAYEIKGLARFRANIFMDRKGMGGVFRIIPSDIMTAEDLNLSKHIMDLCELSKGLVVVTGPTGSGKSTTLCAMVDSINKNREDHIITIEDPIEFTHDNKKCLVNQREVHNHTSSFKDALRAALREDPDILLVGEMRDLETISIAIETAETGHLVFGTLHTTTAASTIDRIIDQFPADRQEQIRVMLSESLRGVIAQTLLPKIGGGRIAALEVLIVTPAVSNLIREGKTFQIPSAMQTGKNKGMVMLNDALMELVNKGLVTPKDAYIKSVDKDGFELLLKRNGKNM